MIEQVIGAGVSDPTALAEAAPWRAVAHPGAIWGPADTAIWWHFADNGEIAQRAIWDSDEREALKQAGSPIDDPSLALRRIASAWERPVRHARKKLILVRSSMAGGEEVKSHPLWHALVAGRPGLEMRIGARAETILFEPAPQFAGRILIHREVEPGSLPERRGEWSAPADSDCAARVRISKFVIVALELPDEMDAELCQLARKRRPPVPGRWRRLVRHAGPQDRRKPCSSRARRLILAKPSNSPGR